MLLCKNCEYVRNPILLPFMNYQFAKCKRPKKQYTITDPVDGNISLTFASQVLHCSVERSNSDQCGFEGTYWTPIPHSKLMQFLRNKLWRK